MKQYDTHVQQRNYIKQGLVMFTRKGLFNQWRFSGNYRPALCRVIMAKMLAAFAN